MLNRRNLLKVVACAAVAGLSETAVGAVPKTGRRTFLERIADKSKGPFFLAHRGATTLAPENTIPSFVCAGRLGLQAIETDVRIAKDGVLVCSHDGTLQRMYGDVRKISDLTSAELKRFVPVKGNGIPTWDKALLGVPTFTEYLDICERFDAVPFIETKGDVAVVKPTLDVVRQRGLSKVAVLSAISFEHIKAARAYDPEIFIHHIFSKPEQLDELAAMGNAGLSYNYKDLSKIPEGLIAKVHVQGVKLCLRAGDTAEGVRQMVALGLDYIPTNVSIPNVLI